MENKYDLTFYNILKDENSITSFLDSVFGFLYRCTDFYHGQVVSSSSSTSQSMAQDLVMKMFTKYQMLAGSETDISNYNLTTSECEVPAACQEIVLETEEELQLENSLVSDETVEHVEISDSIEHTYNGDDRGDYKWSQSLTDVDITIPVSKNICKANQVKLEINVLSLSIKIQKEHEWEEFLDQSFPHSIIPQDSYWSLVAGSYLQINLEKKEKQWWDRLFLCDPAIDVKKIDTSEQDKNLTDQDRLKIQEILKNEHKS